MDQPRVCGRNEGWNKPYISLRIGRLLINVEDPQALREVAAALAKAGRAFGPTRYRPATRRRG